MKTLYKEIAQDISENKLCNPQVRKKYHISDHDIATVRKIFDLPRGNSKEYDLSRTELKYGNLIEYMKQHPEATYSALIRKFQVSSPTLAKIRKLFHIKSMSQQACTKIPALRGMRSKLQFETRHSDVKALIEKGLSNYKIYLITGKTLETIGKARWYFGMTDEERANLPEIVSDLDENVRIRNEEIGRLYEQGLKLRDIGAKYDISHERVRQIVVNNLNKMPRRIMNANKLKSDAKFLLGLGIKLTPSKIIEVLGCDYDYVIKLKKHGLKVERNPTLLDDPELKELAKQVQEEGKSITSLGKDRKTVTLLTRYCKLNGVISKHGRWRDFSSRSKIILDGKARKLSWSKISEKVARSEGRKVSNTAIYQWAQRHHPEIINHR